MENFQRKVQTFQEKVDVLYSTRDDILTNLVLLPNFNPFQLSVIFRYPLKKSGNLWFFDVFRGLEWVEIS